jgi:hypothetical protein
MSRKIDVIKMEATTRVLWPKETGDPDSAFLIKYTDLFSGYEMIRDLKGQLRRKDQEIRWLKDRLE